MTANELRTGNLVMQYGIDYDSGGNKFRDIEGDEIYKVMAISGGNISTYYYDKLIQINLVDIEPIPLTEEWLLNLGFKTDEYKQEFELNTINLDCEYTDKGEWIVFLKGANIKPNDSKNEYVCKYYPKAEIKYVHTLQNLYWCLVGEELVVNKL